MSQRLVVTVTTGPFRIYWYTPMLMLWFANRAFGPIGLGMMLPDPPHWMSLIQPYQNIHGAHKSRRRSSPLSWTYTDNICRIWWKFVSAYIILLIYIHNISSHNLQTGSNKWRVKQVRSIAKVTVHTSECFFRSKFRERRHLNKRSLNSDMWYIRRSNFTCMYSLQIIR